MVDFYAITAAEVFSIDYRYYVGLKNVKRFFGKFGLTACSTANSIKRIKGNDSDDQFCIPIQYPNKNRIEPCCWRQGDQIRNVKNNQKYQKGKNTRNSKKCQR